MGRPRKVVIEDRGHADETATPSRAEDRRGYQTRKAEKRAETADFDQAATYIGKEHWPKGYSYRWVRYKVRGEVDDMNWAKQMRRGYKPVPKSRHIDLFPPMPELGAEGKSSEYIIFGGLVLCEIENKRLAQINRKQEQDTIDQNSTINSWVEGGTGTTPHFGESSAVEYRRAVHERAPDFKEDEAVQ